MDRGAPSRTDPPADTEQTGADPQTGTDPSPTVGLDGPTATGEDGPADGGRASDRANRQAALWATLVAVPVTVAVALFAFAKLSPDTSDASDTPVAGPSATAAVRPQSTAPVELPAPRLGERQATVCRALLSQLPSAVRDLSQRPVTAGAEQNAAYGDPALTLACGVAPVEVPHTDDVWVINGVCWHAVQRPEAAVLTTVDREVPVRVTVPGVYEQPLQWVAPISETTVTSVPSAKTAPAGCRG